MASQSMPNCKQKKTKEQKKAKITYMCKHVIFAFFCLIITQFVMIMSVFFTTEAVAICIQWRPTSSETWRKMNVAGFNRPKVCKKKILCLYSPSLTVHSTKTSRPLRFSELGRKCASKNSVYLISKHTCFDIQTRVFGYPDTPFFTAVSRCTSM